MFDHVTIRVSDLAAAEAFYSTVLRTPGVEPAPRSDEVHAFRQAGVEAVNHNR